MRAENSQVKGFLHFGEKDADCLIITEDKSLKTESILQTQA